MSGYIMGCIIYTELLHSFLVLLNYYIFSADKLCLVEFAIVLQGTILGLKCHKVA